MEIKSKIFHTIHHTRHEHPSFNKALTKYMDVTTAFILISLLLGKASGVIHSYSNIDYDTPKWDHVVDLNEDFRLHWTIINKDITFEVQVRTLGYVGFGFSRDGKQFGSDMAVGWVDEGHTFFQDRYVDQFDPSEPQIDPSQDYSLMKGYENSTHTVLRFRRKLYTCDNNHDIAITNSTMRIMFMYYDKDPPRGSSTPVSLPNPSEAWRPYKPMVLLQKSNLALTQDETSSRILELRNEDVELPYGDDSLFWCKMFKLDKMDKKYHIIKYEPIYDSSWSIHFLQHMMLYECHGNSVHLEELSRSSGRMCLGARSIAVVCNSVVASWSRGSDGFVFPADAGFPLETKHNKFYLLETHFNNINAELVPFQTQRMTDSSGLKIFFTQDLRQHDAGMLSIGMDPNWRHIIPPGQRKVISQGHCMEDCTALAFPPHGVHIFAAMMRTHQIGKEIKLRHIRQNEEFYPIVRDSNVDFRYQDFRILSNPVRIMPGDRLIAECIYDSSSRKAITLGGLTMKEETCSVLTLYYPREKKLTICQSLPSLPTVLHSLGIEQLAMTSNPVVIASPPDLAGMTLETRLLSYDWEHQFDKFQETTLRGPFKPICHGIHGEHLPISEHLTGFSKNISKVYKEPRRCKTKQSFATKTISQLELPVLRELDTNHLGESSVRSSRSSFIETLALSGSSSSCYRQHITWLRIDITSVLILSSLWLGR